MKKVILIILLVISFTGCKSLKKRTEELDALARANSSGVSSSQESYNEEDEWTRTRHFDIKEYAVNDLSIEVVARPKINVKAYDKAFEELPEHSSTKRYKYNGIDFVEYNFLDITYSDSVKEAEGKFIIAFVNRGLQTFVFDSIIESENQVKEFKDWVVKIDSQLK